RGRIDERVGPTELQRVGALFEAHLAGLADQGEVFGVVDGKLDALAVRHRGQIHVLRPDQPTTSGNRRQSDYPRQDLRTHDVPHGWTGTFSMVTLSCLALWP